MDKYPKIKSSLDANENLSGEWIATEKIHGANLSIHNINGEMKLAKRKEFLSSEGLNTFYNVGIFYPQLKLIFNSIIKLFPDNFVLYGELAGGEYSGIKSNNKAIQDGVYYCDKYLFVAFDLLVDNQWVNFDKFNKVIEQVMLETNSTDSNLLLTKSPILRRGKYQEVINTSVDFNSRLPAQLCLPQINDNLAEGWVMKPVNSSSYEKRPIIKKKQDNFLEHSDNSKWATDFYNNELPSDIIVEAINFVNDNRVNSARSKLGNVNNQELIKEITSDILEEMEDGNIILNIDEEKLSKVINSYLNKFLLN